MDSSFQKLINESQLKISVDSVDIQGFGVKDKTCLSILVGPRNNNKGFFSEFNYGEKKPNRSWSFTFSNPQRSSFVVELYKYNLIFKNELLGKAEIKVADIPGNGQSSKQILLRTPSGHPGARVCVNLSFQANDNSCVSYV